MSRVSVRSLFMAALIILPLQYALVGLSGNLYGREQWPAVVLPGFKNVWDGHEAIEVTDVELTVRFADGGTAPLTVPALLADLPRSHHGAFFRTQCQPAVLSGTSDTERCRTADGRAWILRRLAALYPGQTPAALDVVWVRLTYAPTHPVAHATPLNTLSLPLDDPSLHS